MCIIIVYVYVHQSSTTEQGLGGGGVKLLCQLDFVEVHHSLQKNYNPDGSYGNP